MPAKNAIKQYLTNGFYHLYNRGANKNKIYRDKLDYKIFLSYLKNYLVPPYPKQVRPVRRTDLHKQIILIAFCLMPNHFHLLVKQFTERTITHFMRSLTNAYTRYFNQRYDRFGPLFQGRYRGVLVETDEQLLHLSRYIHINPKEIIKAKKQLIDYPYSSYGDYLGIRNTSWVHPEEILSFFKTAQRTSLKDILSYQSFVEDYIEEPEEILESLTLEKPIQVGPVC